MGSESEKRITRNKVRSVLIFRGYRPGDPYINRGRDQLILYCCHIPVGQQEIRNK